jgi:hypothetical protein
MRRYSAEQIGLKYYLSRKQDYESEERRMRFMAHSLMGNANDDTNDDTNDAAL